jgi:hypothetical protein
MTVTLNLPPDIEQSYLAEAQVRGLPLAELMEETLVAARQSANETAPLTPAERVREFEAWGSENANKKFPILSNEALSRESIYEDRGL